MEHGNDNNISRGRNLMINLTNIRLRLNLVDEIPRWV